MSNHYIEEENLSVAWGKALQTVSARGLTEISPLVVAITGFDNAGNFHEHPEIRGALDNMLSSAGHQAVDTVAGTIFPGSMWNPGVSRQQLFDRYQKVFPRIQKAHSENRRGIYFQRMTSGGPDSNKNQLDFIIGGYLSLKGGRRSVLQIAIFDPLRDHSPAPYLGFPCLQHVTFAPGDGTLSVNAFYAMHYVVERAYGNYIGICRLGQFVAHELGLKLSRVTCYAGIAKCDLKKGFGKNELSPMLTVIDRVVAPPAKGEP
jgi:hypothetical protein